MKSDCIFLEPEVIGGTKEHTQWAHYCRARDLYNDYIVCEDCEFYDDGEERGGEK